MATESFLVTALPRSADPGQKVHLSLFVTHRLTPDGPSGVVGDFPTVSQWTAELADARIRLLGRTSGGALVRIPVTADLSMLEAALWPSVFPADLAVRPWQTPDLTAAPWRTFPAHRMQQHAALVHAAAMFSSPVAAPTVAGNALTGPLLQAIGYGQFERRLGVATLLEMAPRLDAQATERLDELTGGGLVGHGVGPAGNLTGAGLDPLTLLAADVHRARRYYQRPEDASTYQERPTEGATGVPISKPDPDFHARAAMLGDASPLLRRLGLVIDLHVEDLAVLEGIVAVQALLRLPRLASQVSEQPWTACAVTGATFAATSSSGDYLGPLLKIGDEERFRVLDLDPDATGLKLEAYVRTMPRLLATETNGDPTNSAPPTLRATGLAVARVDRAAGLRDRLAGAPTRDAALLAGTAGDLHLEDVARGVRLEVWDDVSKAWHSLHRRLIDVEVQGSGQVLTNTPDVGFLQGAALTRSDGPDGGVPGTPYHAHEVLAGWDGWSLAAPRPGKVIVHEDGAEVLKDAPDPDPDPVNPVATTSRVEPGTLPRLRYGRSYALRAWAVDLAGNSAPHQVVGPDGQRSGPDPAPARRRPDPRPTALAQRIAAARLAAIPRDATAREDQPASAAGLGAVREEIRVLRPVVEPGPQEGLGAAGLDLTEFRPTGVDLVDLLVRQRMVQRMQRARAVSVNRRGRIETLFAEGAAAQPHLLERTDAQTPHTVYAQALVAALDAAPALSASSTAALLAAAADLITTPRPFLRWDPVIEPAIVPRHQYTEAESLTTLVIRSGVAGPAEDGLTLTIEGPEELSAQVLADHPELDLAWRADSQRHIAPPKTSQYEAELHGRFDAAMGSTDPDVQRAALGMALRESGTFLDPTVADPDTPGARIAQPGVAFHTSPTAETPEAATPADLTRGDPLTPGQYVVHDVDDLVLPYLPDPLATGLSLVFPDAGAGHHLKGLLAIEGVTLRYSGTWPYLAPMRFVLEPGADLAARVDGDTVHFSVPPGEQLRMRLSSALDRGSLDRLGLWRSLPAALRDNDLLSEAAADGWLWWLTPATEVRLVHAVPRPVEVPRPTVLVPIRTPGDTAVTLFGGVDLHGPSTERLDVEAGWSEQVDDPTKPMPSQLDVVAAAANTTVRYEEDLVVLGGVDQVLPLPDGTVMHLHRAVHQLGDTRHRMIDYRMRAATRYREYFDPRVLPSPEDVSVLGPARTLDVPSTARPAKPVIADVLPLFRWYEETEPEQPFALRRERRTGLRLYLERPWFSSGDGELLAVVLAAGNPAAEDDVSQWGADPVFWQQGPANRMVLPLVDLAHLVGLDDRVEGGRPVGPPVARTLVDVPGQPVVWVLGYRPEFSAERQRWFVDVALDPGTAFAPFVRLAVARYQPSSLPGLHLSPVVRADFVPLPLERTATLSRPDAQTAQVKITGPIGVPAGLTTGIRRPTFEQMFSASRRMRARLETRVPAVPSDLGWRTVAAVDLPVLGFEGTVVTWSGSLELPEALPPQRPGTDETWRVVVEEWETLPADGPEGSTTRLVYADHLPL